MAKTEVGGWVMMGMDRGYYVYNETLTALGAPLILTVEKTHRRNVLTMMATTSVRIVCSCFLLFF